MGGGGLQWRIKEPGLSFLAAAFIDEQGVGNTADEAFALRDDYEARAKLRQYLMTA